MTDEAGSRLAGAVRDRRKKLGLTQADLASKAGLSEPTIRVIETARRSSYEPATLRAISESLGWTSDSIDRILRDELPLDARPPSEGGPSVEERLTRIEHALAELKELIASQAPARS